MKKTLVFLLILFSLSSLIYSYDISSDTVLVISRVNRTWEGEPTFTLLSLDAFGNNLISGSMVDKDISREDIVIDFSIVQINMTKFSGVIYLDISARAFYKGEIATNSIPEIINVNLEEAPVDTTYDEVQKRFVLYYNGIDSIESFSIGRFNVKWTKDPELTPDEYQTQVSLTCTII